MDSDIEEYLINQREKLKLRKTQLANEIQQVKEPLQQFKENPLAGKVPQNEKANFNSHNKCGNPDEINNNVDNVKNASDIDLSQTVDLNTKCPKLSSTNFVELEQENAFQFYDDLNKRYTERNNSDVVKDSGYSLSENLSKAAKDLANRKEIGDRSVSERNSAKSTRNQGDMDQWVSDTFYSYFPSFNQEEQKRENLLRDRQLEYQNYLKQISDEAGKAEKAVVEKNEIQNKRHTTKNHKTDVEIIVNNPPYNADDNDRENLTRPGSTRDKLLQDLTHTDLSNILNSNAVQERNRRSTELEQKKKKEYQKELLRQIEDKRREIQILKEKEKREEELLARKLEEQLKAMKLNEELEKEKKRIEKARLESEQNKAIQLHLLSQLENDYKSHSANGSKQSPSREENKVYKYFSNSARHYENGRYGSQKVFESFESDEYPMQQLTKKLTDLKSNATLNECPHLNKLMCTFCDIKLKIYDSWCKQCQKPVLDDGAENRSLLCENCHDQYMICAACEKQNTLCNFCRRKRNICLHCITNFCIHCGKYMHETDIDITKSSKTSTSGNRSKPSSERSFQILEVSHPESEDNLDENDFVDSGNHHHQHRIDRKLPFSMNLEKKSLFHPDNKVNKEPKIDVHINNGEMAVNSYWKAKDYDEIKEQTSNRLNKYLSNYGDLAARKSRSTQTLLQNTPSPKPKQEQYPSMPLLREISKKKYPADRRKSQEDSKRDRISTLSRKWEIPAVQRLTISNSSPRVLTQVGSFRKQLQAEEFELDN